MNETTIATKKYPNQADPTTDSKTNEPMKEEPFTLNDEPVLTEEELRMKEWVHQAQHAAVTQAPPPSAGRAGTISSSIIKGMELEKWNGAHLEHFSRPSNHVFPLFRYDPPEILTRTPNNSEIEARISQLVTERKSTTSTSSTSIIERVEQDERLESYDTFPSHSNSNSNSMIDPRLATSPIYPNTPEVTPYTTKASSTSNNSRTKPPFPIEQPIPEKVPPKHAWRQKRARRKEQTKEYGWDRPEYLVTPNMAYKTGNMEVWNRTRQLKEDKDIRVPFERPTKEDDERKQRLKDNPPESSLTMVQKKQRKKQNKQNSTAFLPNGLPKKSTYDPNRTFQIISAKHGGIPVSEGTIDMFINKNPGKRDANGKLLVTSDGFKRAQGHVMRTLQLIDRREMALNKLIKLVKLSKNGKTINIREKCKKGLRTDRLASKIDVIRSYTVDICLSIDSWRRTVSSAEKEENGHNNSNNSNNSNEVNVDGNGNTNDSITNVRRAPPYGLTSDTTTAVSDAATYFGLPTPPRPFLWRGLNYIKKMTTDTSFLDSNLQGKYFGAPVLSTLKELTPLLSRVGCVPTLSNPLLLPVTLKECTGRTSMSIIQRSLLPLSIRKYRGLDVSTLRAAGTIFDDEIRHILTALQDQTIRRDVQGSLTKSMSEKMDRQKNSRMKDRKLARELTEIVLGRKLPKVNMAKSIIIDTQSSSSSSSSNSLPKSISNSTSSTSMVLTTGNGVNDLNSGISSVAEYHSTFSVASVVNPLENDAEQTIAHALDIAADLDVKASQILEGDVREKNEQIIQQRPIKTRERLLRDLIELNFYDESALSKDGANNPTIQSMAVSFAQKLMDRNYAKDGMTVVEKFKVIPDLNVELEKRKKRKNAIDHANAIKHQNAIDFEHTMQLMKRSPMKRDLPVEIQVSLSNLEERALSLADRLDSKAANAPSTSSSTVSTARRKNVSSNNSNSPVMKDALQFSQQLDLEASLPGPSSDNKGYGSEYGTMTDHQEEALEFARRLEIQRKGESRESNTELHNGRISPVEREALQLASTLMKNEDCEELSTMTKSQMDALDFASGLIENNRDINSSGTDGSSKSSTSKDEKNNGNRSPLEKDALDLAKTLKERSTVLIDEHSLYPPIIHKKNEIHDIHSMTHQHHSDSETEDEEEEKEKQTELETKNNDETKQQSNDHKKSAKSATKKNMTTTVQLRATIESTVHDISVMYTTSTKKVQILAIDEVAEVHRIVLSVSDVRKYFPNMKTDTHDLADLVHSIGYRMIDHDGRGYSKFLVFTPLFDHHHPPNKQNKTMTNKTIKTNNKSNNDTNASSSGTQSSSTIASSINASRSVTAPSSSLTASLSSPLSSSMTSSLSELPTRLGSPSFDKLNYKLHNPYTISVNAVTKVQRIWRGNRSRSRVQFLLLVKKLRAAKEVSHDAAVAIQSRIRGNFTRLDDYGEKSLERMADQLLRELLNEMDEVIITGTGEGLLALEKEKEVKGERKTAKKKNRDKKEQVQAMEKGDI